jgi:hypothetical protein
MVYVSRSTPYIKRFESFLKRKHWLAVDAWGKDDSRVKDIYAPIVSLIKESVAKESYLKLYPPIWSVDERVTRVARTILVAEFLVREWADHFQDLGEAELEELARSFSFEHCEKRAGLNEALRRSMETL